MKFECDHSSLKIGDYILLYTRPTEVFKDNYKYKYIGIGRIGQTVPVCSGEVPVRVIDLSSAYNKSYGDGSMIHHTNLVSCTEGIHEHYDIYRLTDAEKLLLWVADDI